MTVSFLWKTTKEFQTESYRKKSGSKFGERRKYLINCFYVLHLNPPLGTVRWFGITWQHNIKVLVSRKWKDLSSFRQKFLNFIFWVFQGLESAFCGVICFVMYGYQYLFSVVICIRAKQQDRHLVMKQSKLSFKVRSLWSS